MHKLDPSEIITDHASKHTCRHTVNAAGKLLQATRWRIQETGEAYKISKSRSGFEVITRNRK